MSELAKNPLKLFYCYAHEDKMLADKLKLHLNFLKQQNLVGVWYDREISRNMEWEHEIDRHLSSADIVLLLVSPHLLASGYCYGKEIVLAVQRHEEGTALMVPIILRSVHWKNTPFSELQALPTKAKPVTTWTNSDDAYENIAKGLRRIVKELQNSRKTAEEWFQEGNSLLNLKRYREAIPAFDQAIRLNPTDTLAHHNKGVALLNLKRYNEAILSFDQAIQFDPNYADAYRDRGLALTKLKRYDEANPVFGQIMLKRYDEAIQLNPTDAVAYRNKGVTLGSLRRYDEAILAYDEAIQLNPNDADAHCNKGIALLKLKRYDEAIFSFDKAIQLNPSDPDAYDNKGIALNNLQRYDEAIQAFDEAIRLDPNYARAYDNKGNALYGLERYDEAIQAFDEAIRLDPNYARAYSNKGLALNELQRYEESRIALEKATALGQDTHVPPRQAPRSTEEPRLTEHTKKHPFNLLSTFNDNTQTSTESRRLGKYKLEEKLGQGQIAEMWKALDTQLDRYVAIKLLHADSQTHPEFITFFAREARLSASLHHPNITQIYDFQMSHSPEMNIPTAYIVMDYIEGETLAHYIHATSRVGKFPTPTDIVHLFASISRAIDYAHREGVIHGNIKPANILLDKRHTDDNSIGEPVLTDFGFTRITGITLGTPLYISPEQAQGYPGTEHSDIYSLGIILYKLCTGVCPFRGESATDILRQHISSAPPPPTLFNPAIPPALTATILRAIAKNPAERFSSASALTAAIAKAFNLPLPEGLFLPDRLSNATMREQSTVPLEPIEPSFEQEPTLTYSISVDISPTEVSIGGEVEIVMSLGRELARNDSTYLLEVPQDEVSGLDLNVLLNAPHFHINGENASSLPLDLVTTQDTDTNSIRSQTARFSLTALQSGPVKLQLDLYAGDVFKTSLEYTVQVARIDQTDSFSIHDLTRPRPVRHPDLILQVRNDANTDNTMGTFHYHLTSSRIITQIPDEGIEYYSAEIPADWLKRVYTLLHHTLESTAGAQGADRHTRLVMFGQYLFRSLLPTELQRTLRSLVDVGHTLLILSDQDTVFPWTLLHDGNAFLSEHFSIGRWLRELHDTRPYEFPVGVVSIAYYEGIDRPEIWAEALAPPNAPEAVPLPGGLLNISTTETIRGLHLLRAGKSSRTTDLRDAPVLLTQTSEESSIEQQVQVAKFSLRCNHPLVTLSYLHAGLSEVTALEQSWSSTFIRAGCSAFIGPLWAVEPTVEATFVSTFYARLWAGDTLGDAFKTARELTRMAVPNSIDYLAYALFGDPMARPYRPVKGDGYATVEPVGREMGDPVPPGTSARFRVSLRRRPPIWHEGRVVEVAQTLNFEHLKIYIVTFGLQITPATPITLMHASTGDYFGWFSLTVPIDSKRTASTVQVHFVDAPAPDQAEDDEFDEPEPIHSLRFTLPIAGGDGNVW